MEDCNKNETIVYHSGGDPYSRSSMNDIQSNISISKNKIRDINVKQVDHGYVVKVGCQTIVVENNSSLIAKLTEYILNPSETEQKFLQGKLF